MNALKLRKTVLSYMMGKNRSKLTHSQWCDLYLMGDGLGVLDQTKAAFLEWDTDHIEGSSSKAMAEIKVNLDAIFQKKAARRRTKDKRRDPQGGDKVYYLRRSLMLLPVEKVVRGRRPKKSTLQWTGPAVCTRATFEGFKHVTLAHDGLPEYAGPFLSNQEATAFSMTHRPETLGRIKPKKLRTMKLAPLALAVDMAGLGFDTDDE